MLQRELPVADALALTAAAVPGFLCGLTTFRRTLRWCPTCAETLRCPHCALTRPPTPPLGALACCRHAATTGVSTTTQRTKWHPALAWTRARTLARERGAAGKQARAWTRTRSRKQARAWTRTRAQRGRRDGEDACE